MMKHLLFALLLVPLSYADTITCKVVAIANGDTIRCLADNKEQLKVRLYLIDAPDIKQDFGIASRKALSDLIFNKTVKIETHGKDKYRRTLGTLYTYVPSSCPNSPYVGSCTMQVDINLNMIQKGMAWYWPFAKKNEQYKQAEEEARQNKIGLWSQKAIPPWEFRKNKKS